MNKKLLWALLGVLVIGGGTFAYLKYFGATEKHLGIIPIDASMVIGFDVKSLADKMELKGDFKTTKLYKYFEKMRKESVSENDMEEKLFSQVINDPLGSGISLGSKVYFFMSNKGEEKYMGLTFGMADEEKFVNTCKKVGLKGELKKTKNMSYYAISDGNILCWNSKGLAMIGDIGNSYLDDAGSLLIKAVDEMMGQDESKSIRGSVYFKKAKNQNNDISFFMNYGQYMSMFSGRGMSAPGFENITKIFKGIFFDAGINFENNRIHFEGELTGDKEALEKMDASKDKGLSDNALKCIASGSVLAVVCGNLDIEKTINLYDEMMKPNLEIRKSIKSYAEMNGIKYEDLLNAVSGEISLSLAGFEQKMISQPSYEMNEATGMFEVVPKQTEVYMPKITIAIGVNNKSLIEKLLANTQIPVDNDMRIMPIPMMQDMNIYMVSKDKVLFLTNNEMLGRTVQSNGILGDLADKEVKSLAKDNSGAFYLNMDINQYSGLLDYLSSTSGESKGITQFKTYMTIFKDLKGSSKNRKTEMNINLSEGKGNSLFRLLKQTDVFDFE